MILIGQYDSSFVRRIGIALTLQDIPFEHRPWSVFGDGERIMALNPLMRVPTLVLDDGDVIVDSPGMVDYIEGLLPAERAMLPRDEPLRRRAVRVMALATGLADKAVALFYEQRLHETPSPVWVERCKAQIGATLAALDAACGKPTGKHLFGDRIGHPDIAIACALRHARDSHPDLIDLTAHPALAAHAERLEAMPVFQKISQPFIAPT